MQDAVVWQCTNIGCDRFLGSTAFGKLQCMTVIISVSEWKQLQQLNKYLEMDDNDDCLAFWH